MKRQKTNYPGVFFREAKRIGAQGTEKVFYIVFKKDGKLIEEKAGRQYRDDMTAAKASRLRGERLEGKRISRKEERERAEAVKWTIDRIWEEYDSGKPERKDRRTDGYRYNKFIKSEFGHRLPAELVPLDADRMRIRLQKAKLAPATIKNILEILSRTLNFGKEKHLGAPLGFIIRMPEVHNEKTEDLSPSELGRLLDALENETNIQAANLMRLVLFTGMRRGELFKLKWDDVDFDRGFICLRDPKGGIDQKIPMNNEARDILSRHPRKSIYVFPGRGGKQRTTIRTPVNRIKKAAGLPDDFRPLHGLRHAYASMLASSGQVDMYTLQKLLTHKSPQMTQRYAHLRDDALKRASGIAENIIKSAPRGTPGEKQAIELKVIE